MSGDVQPRKRKDKKRKKDELSVEEPNHPKGTSAILGEGDAFLHSHHDNGTGGHWCAKIIFFSLLAVLVTLIALIIMENRGLSELEANSIESRYSGMLEGWLEEGADDDHHDAHTLDLKYHDEDGEDNQMTEAEDNHSDEEIEEIVEKQEQSYFFMSYFGKNNDNANGDNHEGKDDDEDIDDDLNSNENDLDGNDDDEGFYETTNNYQEYDYEEEDTNGHYEADQHSENEIDEDDIRNKNDDDNKYEDDDDNKYEDDDDNKYEDDDDNKYEDDDDNKYEDDDDNKYEDDDDNKYEDDDDNKYEDDDDDDDNKYDDDDSKFYDDDKDAEETEYVNNDAEYKDDHDDDDDGDDQDEGDDDDNIEIERIEREVSDDEPISVELSALPEEDDDDDRNDKNDDDDNTNDDDNDDTQEDDDFLDHDVDEDLPVVEHISAPSGKPFKEVHDDDSTEETPVDTLADEEEYERRQEELRREQEEASHLWLKVGVGCALLVATHAVVRRALSSGNESENETEYREETPIIDRRMTLVPEQATPAPKKTQDGYRKVIQEEISKRIPAIIQSAPTPTQMSIDDGIGEVDRPLNVQSVPSNIEIDTVDKELYSDEEEVVEEEDKEEVVEEEKEEIEESEGEEELLDDVEVIEEEIIEEEEEDDEISDVDDAELLNRLEAKYGKLPENKNNVGGKSIEDDLWPDEPSDQFWKQELDKAEDDFRQGQLESALSRVEATSLSSSCRARWIQAATLDALAEKKRDNTVLTRAITVYRSLLLDFNEKLSDDKLLQITNRTIDRMIFRGAYLSADPIYRLLIRRFPDEIGYRNNLTISFLMANRAELAANVLNETLKKWPKDTIALAHYAFVLKTHYNQLEESVELFRRALKDDKSPAGEPRFYYHFGDALLLLGRREEADEVHKRGAQLGHFLSPMQRSLYNVQRLKSRPWWNVEETPYAHLGKSLERNWKTILKEGVAAKRLFEEEREGLREKGDWSQMDIFVRGSEVSSRCDSAPVTCATVRTEKAAVTCRRGQIKFSAIQPGTHVRAHTGPTNCRLRMHLALSNTTGTYMRVGTETRQWQVGKVWLFDDSFEHEVWHNGTGTRLVLIVDVWHPDLTLQERRQLPAI